MKNWSEMTGFDEDGYFKDMSRALEKSDSAFELAANEDVVKGIESSESSNYNTMVEMELANWLGSISEDEFARNFDVNWNNKKVNPWVHKGGESRVSLDSRISALVNDEAEGLLSFYNGKDASDVYKDLTKLIQKYPNGIGSISAKKDDRAESIKRRFRELTTLPWNPQNVALVNSLRNLIANGEVDASIGWNSLTQQQKQKLTDEQEQAFRELEEVYSAERGIPETTAEAEGGVEGQTNVTEVEVTPEPKPEKKIADTAKKIAEAIRSGKLSKPGYLQASAGATVWDGAIEIVATAVEAGGDLAQAIADGFEYIRKSDYYKKLSSKEKRDFIKDFSKSINQIRKDYSLPVEPILTIGDMDFSSLKTRLVKGKGLDKKLRDGIEAQGLSYKVENQELANQYANELIDILGLEAAVELATSGKIVGATKTFILGANVSANAKNPNSTEFYEAVNIFDEALGNAGKEIAAAYRVYLNSPEGLYNYEKIKVRRDINKEISEGEKGKAIEGTKGKAKKAKKAAAKAAATETVDSLSGSKDPKTEPKTVSVDAERRKKALEKLNKAKEKLRKARGIATTGGLNPEAIEAIVEIGIANIELGYLNAKAWLRKMRQDLKGVADDVTDNELLDILAEQSTPDGQTLADAMSEARWNAAREELARKAAAAYNQTDDGTFDPVKVVVDALVAKVQSQQKVEAKKPMSVMERLKISLQNRENARKVWYEAKKDVVDIIEGMDISDEEKASFLFDLDYFLERELGLGISESDAIKIVKAEIQEILGDNKSLRDAVERILAQSTEGRAQTKKAFIESLSEKLETGASLSPALADYVAREFAKRYESVVSAEMRAFLNQRFNPRVAEDLEERDKQHDAIVREIIWGALNDEQFASKFYDKYGFGFVNDPEFNKQLEKMARDVYNTPEGFLRQQAFNEMVSFVRVARTGINYWSLPVNAMVNNLLLGVETPFKAIDSNTIQTIAITGQLIAADPKNFKFHFENMFKTKGNGVIALNLRKMGFWMGIKGVAPYKPDVGVGLEYGRELEKYAPNKALRAYGKYLQLSGKALGGIDMVYSKSAEYAKFADLVLRAIKAENNKLPKSERASNEQMVALTNEIIGNTSDKVAAAAAKAEADIKKAYGIEEIPMGGVNPSKEEIAYKARIIEILEQQRQKNLDDVKEKVDWLHEFTDSDLEIYTKYAKMFGEKSSLMGTPRGTAGFISLALQGLGKAAPILKFIQAAPIFVNAPMNFGNLVIDSTPIGLIRAGVFHARGRRGALIGTETAERQGEITRQDSELIYKMERNALWRRVIALNTITQVGLAAMGIPFFSMGDDDEEDRTLTIEKIREKAYYVTGGISTSLEKRMQIEKALGIEPYTVYSYGNKVQNYKNNGMIAVYGMQGAMADAYYFRENAPETSANLYAAATMAMVYFISEQSAMKGFSESLSALTKVGKYEGEDDIGKRLRESTLRNIASSAQSMFLPRLVPALYKDYQGIMQMDKKKASSIDEFLVNDVPFLEQMIITKNYDHFGRPIKEEFFIPSPLGGLSLIGWDNGFFKGPFNDVTQGDKYYELTMSAGYTPKAYRDDKATKTVLADEFLALKKKYGDTFKSEELAQKGIYTVEISLTPEQVAEINRLRGDYVRKWIDDNESILDGKTKEDRQSIFERLFEVGAKYAKTKVTGINYVGTPNYQDINQKRFKIDKFDIELPAME
jgi:hypothetical protein